MEKIVLEKVCWKVKATTAFQFLQLYYSLIQESLPVERKYSLNFERLEAQCKACHCRIIFSKAKPSVLALSIIALEIQAQKFVLTGVEGLQKHSKLNGRDLTFWQKLVSRCFTEDSLNKCSKPNVQKLKWIVSGCN
ncbi:cyclin-G1-like [Fukomys damarensis]|uniref:cyclin-G1-like n=1 Tax=Fukomys damarensis TaxID=885580 RepID=UPI001454F968|nr:cyclin-G1-like [Fukomys damarensis]